MLATSVFVKIIVGLLLDRNPLEPGSNLRRILYATRFKRWKTPNNGAQIELLASAVLT